MKKSTIKVDIHLDEQNVPSGIEWMATDNPQGSETSPAKAMLLSFFDSQTKDTLKIDIWTTELQIHEMDRFMYQTLRGLADTYYRATNNQQLASVMQQFVQYFGEKTELIPPTK